MVFPIPGAPSINMHLGFLPSVSMSNILLISLMTLILLCRTLLAEGA